MDEKEYEMLIDLFQQPGWKKVVEDISALAKNFRDGAPDYAVTNDQWQYLRGQIHQLDRIVGYENYVRAAWEQAQEDDQQEEPHGPVVI